MRFLTRWLDTSTPAAQKLVDAGLIVALLPHVFMAKIPMLVYMLLVAAVLLLRKESSGRITLLFGVLGPLAIAASFLGAFNFVGLREFNTFIQLVSSLLIYAVSLQRLSGKLNFYLVISPMLLLALSYFFYNSIFMLIYAISALYFFLLLMLWMRMHAPLAEALRSATILFVGALPIVALLFMVFPRISYKKTKEFGFKDTASLRTGHDGLMHIGSEALLVPSKKVAMEVWFDEEMPPASQLYFRGSVLYTDEGTVWKPIERRWRWKVLNQRAVNGAVPYRITLYPHKKRWLYLLDYPVSINRKVNYSSDDIAIWDKSIDAVFRYNAASLVAGKTETEVEAFMMEHALAVHWGRDPQSEAAMQEIMEQYTRNTERLEALKKWFRAQRFNYTLKPENIDLEHPIDSFAFGSKKGYCVHFASAFATMARMLELPSRIVTGFKADATDSVENYLVVREKDAHAWVEVYLEEQGWLRIDPTVFSAGIAVGDVQTAARIGKVQQTWWQRMSETVNLHVMYVKYVIHKWVLYYDRSAQMALLRELMRDTLLVLKFAAAFAVLMIAAVVIFITMGRERCSDPVLCAVRPLLKTLRKHGLDKSSGEDMHAFLQRSARAMQTDLTRIDSLYHELRYGGTVTEEKLRELERICRDFRVSR